jgi:uncharacterized protein with HEPN domain
MPQPDVIRLRHMLDSARVALMLAENKTRDDLNRDIGLVLALMKSIEIIGEAAGKLSDRFREEHSAIPWERIIGMRNRLIHAYYDINRDILWQTVVEDLPSLIRQLEAVRPPE